MKKEPRSASILCEEDCHFAVLDKRSYKESIGKLDK